MRMIHGDLKKYGSTEWTFSFCWDMDWMVRASLHMMIITTGSEISSNRMQIRSIFVKIVLNVAPPAVRAPHCESLSTWESIKHKDHWGMTCICFHFYVWHTLFNIPKYMVIRFLKQQMQLGHLIRHKSIVLWWRRIECHLLFQKCEKAWIKSKARLMVSR